MIQFKSIIFIAIIGLAVLLSGCTGSQDTTTKPTIAPTPIPTQISTPATPTSMTPQSSITVRQSESGLIKLVHLGGDSIFLNDVKIIITQGGAIASFEKVGQNNDKFAAGDTLYIMPNGINLNGRTLTIEKISIENSKSASGSTTITLIYLPNGKEIARISTSSTFFSSTSTSTAQAPQSSITISKIESGLVKLSHLGGDSIFLSDVEIIIEGSGGRAIYEPASQDNDKFVQGDTLDITPIGISLNGRTLNTGKISIERFGGTGCCTVTLIHLPSGKEIAKILRGGVFFS